ncbi:MAG: DUF92 domain-containing protein [Bacteroidetes bacterium]|nr:DUF92 domain-containing protein [Bacteroidota bacterium]
MYVALALLIAGAAASVLLKKLTLPAAITGVLTGWAVYAADGYTGLLLLATFFILGTAATSWKKSKKRSVQAAAAHQSTRKAGQVIANAGVAAICGVLTLLLPEKKELFQLMIAGSLSAATADTLSSELGMAYGRRFVNILTWKPDEKGQDGVISIEGLLFGIAGSAIIALIANNHFIAIIIAGTIGNLVDSLLGALFERRGYISNDAVNFLNTLTGALTAAIFFMA